MSLEIVTFVVLLVLSIESRQADISYIIEKLQQLEGRVIIQSIPGHLNIPGNELADKYAQEIFQNGKTAVFTQNCQISNHQEGVERSSPKVSSRIQSI